MAGQFDNNRLQVSGYRFLVRRMEHALVRGDVRMARRSATRTVAFAGRRVCSGGHRGRGVRGSRVPAATR